ncbi:MAG: hypothetical protein IPO35_17035 [Uliginosibacterium sp.]|nr:hypothetical protein [Uliginosibacterium sp.]
MSGNFTLEQFGHGKFFASETWVGQLERGGHACFPGRAALLVDQPGVVDVTGDGVAVVLREAVSQIIVADNVAEIEFRFEL